MFQSERTIRWSSFAKEIEAASLLYKHKQTRENYVTHSCQIAKAVFVISH